jgi:hypothetical protein
VLSAMAAVNARSVARAVCGAECAPVCVVGAVRAVCGARAGAKSAAIRLIIVFFSHGTPRYVHAFAE